MDNKQDTNNNTEHQRRQIITFAIGAQRYALPIEEVKEVVLTPEITPIPLTPNYLKGVANVRGDILAMINLAERFGKNEAESQRFTLVLSNHLFKVGLLTTEIPNTRNIAEENIDFNPQIVQNFAQEQDFIRGIIRDGQELLILLNIEKLINAEEISQISQITQTNQEEAS